MVDAGTTTGRFLLAFVFLGAALPKLVARADFQEAVANYALLPERFVAPVARLLPPLELVVAYGGTDYCTDCQPDGNCYNGPC